MPEPEITENKDLCESGLMLTRSVPEVPIQPRSPPGLKASEIINLAMSVLMASASSEQKSRDLDTISTMASAIH